MAPVFVFCLFLYTHLAFLLSAGYGTENHDKCPSSFDCGDLGTIHYPFTRAEKQDCGLIAIQGCEDDNPSSSKTIQLEKNGKSSFSVTSILQPDNTNTSLQQITNFDQQLHDLLQSNKSCEAFNNNLTIPANSPLVSFDIKYNITLYRCDHSFNVSTPNGFNKHHCPDFDIYHYRILSTPPTHTELRSFSKCSVVVLPKKDLPDTDVLLSFLTAQMTLDVQLSDDCDECYNHKGGLCRLDRNRSFYCEASAVSSPLGPPADQKSKVKLAMGLGIGSSIGVVMLLFLACCFKRKLFPAISNFFYTKYHPNHQMIEAFLKQHGHLSTRRHSYSNIMKITSCFKMKLGQGGYGSVYKGKLQDGRLVAVKVLSELKGSGEEFINEVASISRTSHVNIVNLLGFCFQGSKRALIYEFMPNGSLEKFIYEENPNMENRQLDCKTLYDIAIGVARGLEYLHRGCNTRILHFDIKPHNILLDEDFCPKISDFGLAKLCPTKESIVSLTGARGTAGYIAPEVFCRNFGEVSYKSDVYSYGMMVVEMVGGRRNIKVEVDCSSEIYFPHWIYKRLELNQELGLRCIKNEIGKELIRKMTLVSLWCIQTDPLTRPTMSRVVEMLEGSTESLQVPPKPYLSSPSRSPVHYSSQTCETL